MPHYQAWEEFTRAAEKLYLADPMKVRVVLKYRHCDGNLCIKVTDDVADSMKREMRITKISDALNLKMLHGMPLVASAKAFQDHLQTDMFTSCLLYRTDQAQDVKKIEKFHSQLMRLMVAKESRSAAMETD